MIARIIRLCVANPLLVLMLLAGLIGAGIFSVRNIPVDAIPDLSEVQVIIRTDYPGQAPQIVEDQVTYPLANAMLSVPQAQNVRGFSMFGSSFVYVIFEDGTDIYWARSRVLEQLSGFDLPAGAESQLGPDATGVGWVYQYVLSTGDYCPNHPDGLWFDPATDEWYAEQDAAPVPDRLERRRHFERPTERWIDPERPGHSYAAPDLAPEHRRDDLQVLRSGEALDHCPIDGTPLVGPDVDIADLRSIQDWTLRYELQALDDVSEVAAVGGMVRRYQVTIDPNVLRNYGITTARIAQAIRASNQDVGGGVIESGERELMVISRGNLGSRLDADGDRAAAVIEDLELVNIRTAVGSEDYTTVDLRLGDIAEIRTVPTPRRGIAEWNGQGETVGGIVVMRFGANARSVITDVEERLDELRGTLPPGVDIQTAYSRADLIDRSITTLTDTLLEEILVVSLVVLLFLLHARSALVAVVVLPTGVLGALGLMYLFGINANIMSLGGIAIAIGVMVDSAIIMVENAHKGLEREADLVAAGAQPRSRRVVIGEAASEVGPSLFFSLLIITVSFLPVFILGGQSGRLFTPLAFTKTFAMAVAAVLSITAIPVLMSLFISERVLPQRWSRARSLLVIAIAALLPAIALALAPLPRLDALRWWLVGGWIVLSLLVLLPQRLRREERNPISRFLQWAYDPFFAFARRFRWLVLAVGGGLSLWIIAALLGLFVGYKLFPFSHLGSEFMPPLEEGDFLYMPNTDPGLSITKARELLQQTDRLIKQFPEVDTVMGKIGRADTATDPAPLTMIETTIALHRDRSRWRTVQDHWLGLIPYQRTIEMEELTDGYRNAAGDWVPGINEALRLPGLTGALTPAAMPIRTRIDMLATGIRTPVGIKVLGPDIDGIDTQVRRIEEVLRSHPDLAPITASVAADRVTGGFYVEILPDRHALARHGVAMADLQQVVAAALGGSTLTWTIEGRERYPVNLRYAADLRADRDDLGELLLPTAHGGQIPLSQVARIVEHHGPPMLKSENARLTSWLYVTPHIEDLGGYVATAQRVIADEVRLDEGYSIVWSGSFEQIEETNRLLAVAVPMALLAILFLLYVATRSWLQTGIVLVAVPFSLIGAFGLLLVLDYQLSVAVWVGMIALAGIDAETGLVMLHYLDDSCKRFAREGKLNHRGDLWTAIHDGAVRRIRPKTMTVCTTFIGLMPLMLAEGAGSDTMRRLAAPMVGGLATSFIGELMVYPVLWYLARSRSLPPAPTEEDAPA